MATNKRGGHVSTRQAGQLDPRLGKILSRLIRGTISVTWGSDFPIRPTLGDMHYYTGVTNDSLTQNKWYAYTPNETWESMNASQVEGNAIRGDIPAGVTIADYLSKYGGKMEGEITFSEDQEIPADKLKGAIPSGVSIKDYLSTLGGNLLGTLFMTHHDIRDVALLKGYDANIYIDMNTDGEMSLAADTQITLTAATITLVGALVITGNLTISGDLRVDGGDIGLTADTDLIQIAANLLTINGAQVMSGDLQVNGGDIGTSTDTDLIQLAADLLTVNGSMKIGDVTGGNYLEIESDGTIEFHGNATVWDDLRVPANLLGRLGVSTDPTWVKVTDNGAGSVGVYALAFADGQSDEVFFAVQMPHGWKEGSNIEPHIHWYPDGNGGVDEKVSWGLEYTWVNRGAVIGSSTIIYANTAHIDEDLVDKKHYRTNFSEISGTGKTISSMLICRLWRDGTGVGLTDDYTNDAILLEVDFHYEMDTVGSRTIDTK